MKKILFILLLIIPIVSFSQVKGEYVGFEELFYHYDGTEKDTLIVEHPDSARQYRYLNMAKPEDDLDGANKRYVDQFNQPFDSVLFSQQETKEHTAGMMYFDSVKNNFVLFDNNTEVALDVGKEGWIDVYNNTGSTIMDGEVGTFYGNGGIHPSIRLARSDLPVNMNSRLGVVTHPIEDQTYGRMTIWGLVRDYNTSGMSTGQKLYLSPTTFGGLTATKPKFPNTSILIATVDSVGVNGSINVNIIGDPSKVLGNLNNGCFVESFTFSVSSDGTTIKGSLVNKEGNDWLIMKFSDGLDTLDLTSPREINLIAGTDGNPQKQYVYIDESTRDLAVSTSYWSTTEHIPVAEIVVQSALTVQTVGAIRNQNINNHVADDEGMGGLDHIRKRIRTLYCVWEDGVASTVTGNNITTTGGNAWQMHLQPYDAWDLSTDYAFLPNSPIQNYKLINTLTDMTTDASGGTLKNNEYSIVLVGIQNSGNDPDQMFINMPLGTYNNVSNAIDDDQKYSVYTIPNDYRGVGFLIARLTFSNANNVWTLEDTEDLRGSIPNNIAGGGGTSSGGYTTFLELDDTPSAYTSSENKLVSVSSAANALEFSEYTTTDLDTIGINSDSIRILSPIIRALEAPTVNLTTAYTSSFVQINSSAGTNTTIDPATSATGTNRAGVITPTTYDNIVLNTAKITNATHTLEVTGDEDLIVSDNVIDPDNLKSTNSPTLTLNTPLFDGTNSFIWSAGASGGGTPHELLDGYVGYMQTGIADTIKQSNIFYDDVNEFVGIGIATPAYKLHLKTDDVNSDIYVGLQNDAQLWRFGIDAVNGVFNDFFKINDGTNGNLSPFQIEPSTPTNTITLRSSGNVGIGTANPTEKLEIEGDIIADTINVLEYYRNDNDMFAELTITNDTIDRDDSYNSYIVATTAKTIVFENLVNGCSGDFTILYSGSSTTTTITPTAVGFTIQIEGSIQLSSSVIKAGTPNKTGVYSYKASGNILHINGTQYY